MCKSLMRVCKVLWNPLIQNFHRLFPMTVIALGSLQRHPLYSWWRTAGLPYRQACLVWKRAAISNPLCPSVHTVPWEMHSSSCPRWLGSLYQNLMELGIRLHNGYADSCHRTFFLSLSLYFWVAWKHALFMMRFLKVRPWRAKGWHHLSGWDTPLHLPMLMYHFPWKHFGL